MSDEYPIQLAQLRVILVSGADAKQFLQGQLTADLDALSRSNVLLAACNSAQGRVQAVVWMVERSDGVAVLVSQDLLDSTLMRLRRYVLRAKVTLDSELLQAGLLAEERLPSSLDLQRDRSHSELDKVSYVRLAGHRQIVVITLAATPLEARPEEELTWRCDHLRAGLPQVYPPTHERFVAQMLNLDILDGISFEKGCYTGQEIIARTHFRGAIKRRMFRYAADHSPPAPGTRILLGDQHAGDVVDAVPTESGCELLAVVNLTSADAALELDGGTPLERLSLPYDV